MTFYTHISPHLRQFVASVTLAQIQPIAIGLSDRYNLWEVG
ncbi:hypothetical protein [Almyronema epifaneia]|uniref:Uncharacterized protein n=1 Tax=Almyronema epifaneia S1 TaxID=2991925 RepID=A0ABW6ILT6_9CYAN